MNKQFKKLATYSVDEMTMICDVDRARKNLKEGKSYIVDEAVEAFERITYRTFDAVCYINVTAGAHWYCVSILGYVFAGPVRTADQWFMIYQRNVETGKCKLMVVDENNIEYNYDL